MNRIGESSGVNIDKGFPAHFSRLERLHNAPIVTRLNGIYPLGVLAYARVPGELRQKFEPRAVACLYLGLHDTVKGVRLLQLNTNKTMVTENCHCGYPFQGVLGGAFHAGYGRIASEHLAGRPFGFGFSAIKQW